MAAMHGCTYTASHLWFWFLFGLFDFTFFFVINIMAVCPQTLNKMEWVDIKDVRGWPWSSVLSRLF